MVVTHLPGDSLTRTVSSGTAFELLVGPMTDETGQHGPLSQDPGNWSPGEPVTRTLTLFPVDPGEIESLVFTLRGAEISWHRYDLQDNAYLQVVLPRGIF